MRQPLGFMSFSAYEAHYQKQHCNVCFTCRKVFPSLRMMDLHISEVHDPFFRLKKEKGEKIFKCFIENCQESFINVKKRKKHLIGDHFYPKEYHFGVIYTGISSRDTSLLSISNRNVKKKPKSENLEKMVQDSEIEKLATQMTSTRLVPSTIRFRGGRNR